MPAIESMACNKLQATMTVTDTKRKVSFLSMESLAQRIKHVRKLAGLSQEKFAEQVKAVGPEISVTRGAVGNWELGGAIDTDNLRAVSERFGVSMDWLATGRGKTPTDVSTPGLSGTQAGLQSARAAEQERRSFPQMVSTIPVYGSASAGADGRFLFNGERIAEIPTPPVLEGVVNAYAVYVDGLSMIPRYEPGETVYVNPHLVPRKGDYVLVQVQGQEGEPPEGYIKRFVSKDIRDLHLEQFNPRKRLKFPLKRVLRIHRIVMGGDGK